MKEGVPRTVQESCLGNLRWLLGRGALFELWQSMLPSSAFCIGVAMAPVAFEIENAVPE